jgi:hypothetical protein
MCLSMSMASPQTYAHKHEHTPYKANLKDSYPVLKLFRVFAADWGLWTLYILGSVAAGIMM